MRRPLVHLALWLIAGQILGRIVPLPEWSLWLGCGTVILGQFLLIAKQPQAEQSVRARGVLLLVLFAIFGALGQKRIQAVEDAASASIASLDSKRLMQISGSVKGNPLRKADGWSAVLDHPVATQGGATTSIPSSILITFKNNSAESRPMPPPMPGQSLTAHGKLLPGDPPGNPLQFDYNAYLRMRNIAAAMICNTPGQIRIDEPQSRVGLANRYLRLIQSYKTWSCGEIERFVSAQWSPLMRSMLFGETYLLDDAEKQAINRTGLAHLLAVSGQHATLITLLVFVLLRVFSLPWRLTWVITSLFVWTFAALVGFQPPVVRAAVLASAIAFAHIVRREPDALNSLAMAALIVLLIDPRSLYKADFQLSYMSVFSIIILQPSLRSVLTMETENQSPYRRRLAFLYNVTIGSPMLLMVASQIALLPLLAHYFHQFSPIGLVTNVLLVWLASGAIVLGFIMITMGALFVPIGFVLGWLCQILLLFFHHGTHYFASIPWASISMAPLPWWGIGAFYFILFYGSYLRPTRAPGEREKARARLILHAACLLAFLVWTTNAHAASGEMMVRVLDVGQGDATVIRFPTGQTMLIDAGSSQTSDKGKQLVVPFLKAHGITRLNALVVTHADSDHAGGVVSVLNSLPVDLVIQGPQPEETKTSKALKQAIRENKIPVHEVRAGDRIDGVRGCRIAVLGPPKSFTSSNDNDQSVVIRIDCGESSFLFTGDATTRAERAIIATGADLDCDVLKAGHHGSSTSSSETFLDAVTPEIVLISAGKNNRYRHPHSETLDRFKAQHARILRTDQSGSIAIFTDGESMRIETVRRHK